MTDDLRVRATYAYHDARYTRTPGRAGRRQRAGAWPATGSRFRRRISAALGPDLRAGELDSGMRQSSGITSASVSWTRRTKRRCGSYTTVDAGIGYRFARWELRLDGYNLSDRRDPVAISELGDGQAYRLPGRSAMLTAVLRLLSDPWVFGPARVGGAGDDVDVGVVRGTSVRPVRSVACRSRAADPWRRAIRTAAGWIVRRRRQLAPDQGRQRLRREIPPRRGGRGQQQQQPEQRPALHAPGAGDRMRNDLPLTRGTLSAEYSRFAASAVAICWARFLAVICTVLPSAVVVCMPCAGLLCRSSRFLRAVWQAAARCSGLMLPAVSGAPERALPCRPRHFRRRRLLPRAACWCGRS